jgi:hypothetical protein
LSVCPNGYYSLMSTNSSITDSCELCSNGCLLCTAFGLTSCSQCGIDSTTSSKFYLGVNSTTCYNESCPNGQYINSVTSPYICLACNSMCTQCSSTAANCTFCTGTVGQITFLNRTASTCVASCDAGSYGFVSSLINTTNECRPCFDGCATCTSSGNNSCMTCANNSDGQVMYKWTNQTVCDFDCPLGEYANSSIPYICQICDSNCVTCNTSNPCASCNIPYYYDVQLMKCTNSCRTGYYMNRTSSSSYFCSACAIGCA